MSPMTCSSTRLVSLIAGIKHQTRISCKKQALKATQQTNAGMRNFTCPVPLTASPRTPSKLAFVDVSCSPQTKQAAMSNKERILTKMLA